MAKQNRFVPHDEQASDDAAPQPLRELSLEELPDVVGGPIIDNGGIVIAPAALPNKG